MHYRGQRIYQRGVKTYLNCLLTFPVEEQLVGPISYKRKLICTSLLLFNGTFRPSVEKRIALRKPDAL